MEVALHHRRRALSLVLGGALLVVFAGSAMGSGWKLEGVQRLDLKEALALLGDPPSGEGAPGQVRAALDRLLLRYRQEGFYFAQAEAQPEGEGTWRVRVQEGLPARLERWGAVGVTVFSDSELREVLGLRAGSLLNEKRLDAAWKRLVRRYAERGYPFAQLQPVLIAMDPQQGTVAFELRVEEGPKAIFERIEVEGLQKTREEVVRRLIPFQEGDPFDIRKVESARRRLARSGLFAAIHPSDLKRGDRSDGVVYRLRVQEARTLRVAGLLGYAPPAPAVGTPQVTGYLELGDRNLFGTGRALQWRWESAARRMTALHYLEPFFFGTRLTVETAFQAERIERTVFERWTLLGRWPFASFWEVGGLVRWLRDSTGTSYGVGVTALYDSRDGAFFPTVGSRLALSGEVYRGDFRFQRFEVDGERYLPVARRTVGLLRLRGGLLLDGPVPEAELFYLGGGGSLRGHRERDFSGRAYLLASAELRRRTGRSAYGLLFLDVGSVRSESGPWISPQFGYGLGLLVESRGGLLRIQYALQPGASLLEGKVHLQVGTEF
ncbi:MAG: membrane protein [Candidatus Poribacteria bacterium]|nr:MAG: membrane protein [Candidatus Poribacteria bacterium]